MEPVTSGAIYGPILLSSASNNKNGLVSKEKNKRYEPKVKWIHYQQHNIFVLVAAHSSCLCSYQFINPTQLWREKQRTCTHITHNDKWLVCSVTIMNTTLPHHNFTNSDFFPHQTSNSSYLLDSANIVHTYMYRQEVYSCQDQWNICITDNDLVSWKRIMRCLPHTSTSTTIFLIEWF